MASVHRCVGFSWYTFSGLVVAALALALGGPAAATAYESCWEILDADPLATDGAYTIDLDGAPVDVYCDMTTDGGGWTRVVYAAPGAWMSDDGVLGGTIASGTPHTDAISGSAYSLAFASMDYGDMLFASGDGSAWAVLDVEDVITPNEDLLALNALVKASAGVGVAAGGYTNVLMRAPHLEDPWIGFEGDHWTNISRMLYGEYSYPAPQHLDYMTNHGGAAVFVRPSCNGHGTLLGDLTCECDMFWSGIDCGSSQLVARWAADGDATDATGNGFDGTFVGAEDYAPGLDGQAFEFSGDGDGYVEIADDPLFDGTSPFSISAWIVPTGILSEDQIVSKSTHTVPSGWEFRTYGTELQFTYRDTYNVRGQINHDALVPGVWNHVVATWDGVTLTTYVDGVSASGPGAGPMSVNDYTLRIGDNQGAGDAHGAFDGRIDDVRFYAGALDQAEVDEIFTALDGEASAPSFSEDFDEGEIPANFVPVDPADVYAPTLDTNGADGTYAVNFTGPYNTRRYVRTAADNYADCNFVAEVTMWSTISQQYFGIGTGVHHPTFYGVPTGSTIYAQVHAPGHRTDTWAVNSATNYGEPDNVSTHISGYGGSRISPYRLRMEWDADSRIATFTIDDDYAGGPMVADDVISVAAQANFGDAETRIFFGGDNGTIFDDFTVVCETDPVAWWMADGDETDATGNGFDGLWYGNEAYATGIDGQAFDLDGSSYIVSDLDENVSASLWLKADVSQTMGLYTLSTTPGQHYSDLFTYTAGAVGGGFPGPWSDGVYLAFWGNDIAVPFDAIMDGKWHQVTMSWDGADEVSIAIDGTFPDGYLWGPYYAASWVASSQPFTLPLDPSFRDADVPDRGATIGAVSPGSGLWGGAEYPFDGLIDDVQAWERALTDSEIEAGYDLFDADFDGVADPDDVCDGYDDNLDFDGDEVPDDCDTFPLDPTESVDTDGDGVGDNGDACPGYDDTADLDGDAVPDDCDDCPLDADNDLDEDGVCGDVDNCPVVANADQADWDSDGAGDVCDTCPYDEDDDIDVDTVCGDVDNCPAVYNADQANADGDQYGDVCDTCPNDEYDDADNDGVCGDVDACPGFDDNADLDADGLPDDCDTCPNDGLNDADGDGVCGDVDACPGYDDNADADADGLADGCDTCPFDADDDGDGDGVCAEGPGSLAPPLACWQANGDATDGTGNGHDAVAHNGVGYDTGVFGDGFAFDGVDDYLAVADDPALQLQDDDMSISLWMRIDGSPNGAYDLIDKMVRSDSQPVGGYLMHTMPDNAGSGVRFCYGSVAINGRRCYDAHTTPLVDGTFHHVAAVKSGEGVTIYVDGADEGTEADSSAGITSYPTVGVGIGRRGNDTNYVDGVLDQVLIYDRSLTAAEVAQLADTAWAGQAVVCDDVDECPSDADKTAAGQCGCGVADTDTDLDGTPDCLDTEECDGLDNDGDGDVDEGFDADGDGIADCFDTCPLDANNDLDADGVCGDVDNCPATANADQLDTDADGAGNACDADDDNDGYADGDDAFPLDATEWLDSDGDGTGDNSDPCPNDANNDVDSDGVCGDVDNCPATANADQLNTDGDTEGNACDADDDNDGYADGDDAFPLDASEWLDSDGDGIGDNGDSCPLDADNDADSDTVCGDVDNCPATANADQLDTDADGAGNACDADDDNDGFADGDDAFPLDATEWLDSDGDGTGDNSDTCPLDAYNDADSDTVCGDVDNCPAVSNADQLDTDADGAGNACDADDDNDGYADGDDAFPLDATEWLDSDGDGTGDNADSCPLDADDDLDADGICGDVDNCPAVSNASQLDTDGDTQGDACDADDDNDGYADGDDAFPLDATEWLDSDGDGTGDNADSCPLDADDDADNDGVCGDVDACPGFDDNADADADGLADGCDACPNDADNDADSDGVCGDEDNCPDDANGLQDDADGDGAGDVCDACPEDANDDWDLDLVCGDVDNCPDDYNDDQADADNDGAGDECDVCPDDADDDIDGDGVCGDVDNCVTIANGSQLDSDGDLAGDACDACPFDAYDDIDGDGVCGDVDVCPGFDDNVDTDGDSLADGCDACPLDPDNDADSDGVCGDVDVCPGFDDNVDTDGDSLADGCDACPNDAANDADGDGVCGDVDACPGHDDNVDTDGDSLADGCDACPNDAANDADGDGVCGDVDVCPGFDDNVDTDGDGTADGCDTCPNDAANDADGDGVCGDVDACPGFDDNADADSDGLADGCDACPFDLDNDIDGDGVCGDEDNCPDDANGYQDDADGDGAGDACDICPDDANDDWDYDGICGDEDNCPDDPNVDQADADYDDTGDVCDVCPDDEDDDIDGDGVCGDVDNCVTIANASQLDSDGDLAGDACDACPFDEDDDIDGDGVCGDVDNCPATANATQVDADADGAGDACDACPADANDDIDGDGICGDVDNCPDDANADQADNEGDGLGDVCDDDDDDDTVLDGVDNCPTVANADQADNEGDGLGDVCDTDDDDDGVLDVSDNCAFVANAEQANNDGDSFGDACDDDDDDDGVLDDDDNCAFVANADQIDTDLDGQGNACDGDDDGDGIDDGDDNCPLTPNAPEIPGDPQDDLDGDGQGDACDADDDGDGVLDDDDNCQYVVNPDQDDFDGDGIGDACDADVDGDGVVDEDDNCPWVANVAQDDTDFDGYGDACDDDDDGDLIYDEDDNCPFVYNPDQADADGDYIGDDCDTDLDGDGWDNGDDNCPADPNADQYDFDLDGEGDACDADIDDDGVLNDDDVCAFTEAYEVVDGSTGCSIEQLCPCEGPRGNNQNWRNHGKYVSCVAHSANSFLDQGLITDDEKDDIVSEAGQSDCGHKNR